MNKSSGGRIGWGSSKEISIIKSETALGLTLADHGTGYAYVKKIKKGSVIDRTPYIMVGDHIEKINNVWVIGKRHHIVAKILKEIPVGSTFTIRLTEPMNSTFQRIGQTGPQSDSSSSINGSDSGMKTLTFNADGVAVIEDELYSARQKHRVIDAINSLLDSFLGINDSELAEQIRELGTDKMDLKDFAAAIDDSDLVAFGFTDDFIIDLWKAIEDARRDTCKN